MGMAYDDDAPPLRIVVFGPPGSDTSAGLQRLVGQVTEERKLDWVVAVTPGGDDGSGLAARWARVAAEHAPKSKVLDPAKAADVLDDVARLQRSGDMEDVEVAFAFDGVMALCRNIWRDRFRRRIRGLRGRFHFLSAVTTSPSYPGLSSRDTALFSEYIKLDAEDDESA